MAFTEKDSQAMDNAAAEAENDLADLSDEAIAIIANWLKKWYMRAGYKRLGRVLLQYAEQKEE